MSNAISIYRNTVNGNLCNVKGIYKMKKKLFRLLFSMVCVIILLTGCSASSKNVFQKEQETEVSSPIETSDDEVNSNKENSEEATSDTESIEEATSDTQSIEETNLEESESSAPQQTIDLGAYVDLNNMQFAINGKVYTLGKTTLQTLIDDGVPFDKDDLLNANNNIDKNSKSEGFEIELDEYWDAQVYTMNDSDENKTIAECYIYRVYLPVHQDQKQNIIAFAFPLDITLDQLKEAAGESTDSSHRKVDDRTYDTLEYKKESTRYYANWGYKFEFMNGELQYVSLDYIP